MRSRCSKCGTFVKQGETLCKKNHKDDVKVVEEVQVSNTVVEPVVNTTEPKSIITNVVSKIKDLFNKIKG